MSRFLLIVLALALFLSLSSAADWPQWGGGPTRNPVSLEKGLPLDFRFAQTDDAGKVTPARNIAWQARVGDRMVVPPVIADGLVWVCTSGQDPNDEKINVKDWDGGVLACLRESDGKLLWKHFTPRLGKYTGDWPRAALGSAPLVEGDRLWYVTNRHEIICLDIAPLKKGIGKPREAWKLDMPKDLGVSPYLPGMQFGFAASVAGHKDRLFVVTHNGVDENHANVPAPNAPSLVCLEKATGKVLWKDASPGKDIMQCQISSPLVAEVGGKVQVIIGQGDGWLRSFEASTGKLIWKCDLNLKDSVWELGGACERNYVVATPILYNGLVYIPTGQEAEHSSGIGALYCIDPTKMGDVSRELEVSPNKGKPNPNSAVVWYTPKQVPADAPRILVGKKKKRDLLRDSRDYYFGRSISGCVAHDGLVYAAELGGIVYCFDAKTGKLYWFEDTKGGVRGQLLWADGKILVANDDGLFVFAHGKEKKLVAKVEADIPFLAGPVFANGTLYLTEENTLYAIRNKK